MCSVMRSVFVAVAALGFFGCVACIGCIGCSDASPELASTPQASREFTCEESTAPELPTGETFDSIYNDLLGPSSVAKCATSGCHGGASKQGYISLGYTADEAYCGLVTGAQVAPGAGAVLPALCADASTLPSDGGAVDTVQPGKANGLIAIIESGRMPRPICGNRSLRTAEIARIKAWAAAGAQR
jgi:hypothetical protein